MIIDIKKICNKLVHIRYERLLLMLYIPYMIINISRADASYIIMAIVMHSILLIGVYYGIYTTRQDIKQDIKEMQPMIIKISIKKEIFTKVFNNIPTTANIKYNSFLNNSIN